MKTDADFESAFDAAMRGEISKATFDDLREKTGIRTLTAVTDMF